MRASPDSTSSEFTSTLTDFGYKEFMLADLLRRDPLFLRDGRLLVDVRGGLGLCVNGGMGGGFRSAARALALAKLGRWGFLTHAPIRTTHNR